MNGSLSPPLNAVSNRLLGRGGWAILDQATFSAANLLIHFLLVRWLPDESEVLYGAFMVGFVWFQAIGTIHTALLVEPMLVFGVKRSGRRLQRYYSVLSAGTLLFGVVSTVAMLLLGLGYSIWGHPAETRGLVALGLASPCIWLLWYARRVCYVHLQPHRSAIGGLLYGGLIVSGLYCVHEMGYFSIRTAVAVFGASSAVIAILLLMWERVPLPRLRDWPLARRAWREHLRFGRWSVASGMVSFIPNQIHYFLLPAIVGLAAGGSMRAVGNLFQPFIQANAAFCVLLIPLLARSRGTPGFGRTLRLTLLLIIGAPTLWWLVCGVFNARIFELAYGDRFADAAPLVWLLGLVPIILGLSDVAAASLKANDRPDRVFWGGLVAAIFSLTAGVWLIWQYGVIGAAVAIVVALSLQMAISLTYAVREVARTPATSDPGGDLQPARLDVEDGKGEPDAMGTVLINAFACEPGRGSEPGIGWNLLRAAAVHRPVVAVVHPLHTKALNKALRDDPSPFPVRIVYVGLPKFLDRLWASHLTLNIYYYIWQFAARREMRRIMAEEPIESIQHITYGRYWMPTAAGMLDQPFIWGPVGGGETMPPAFLRDLPFFARWGERLRMLMRWTFERDPLLKKVVANARLGLATSPETADRMRALGLQDVRVLPGAWLGEGDLREIARNAVPDTSTDRPLRLITVGRQLSWKGTHLAIAALAEAKFKNIELWIVGDGPALPSLKRQVRKLDVADQVVFFGWQTRQAAMDLLGRADAMIFPSLHDSGGMAVLEALAAGRPVVCLNLGGPGLMVDDTCGRLIEATTPRAVVEELAHTLREWSSDRIGLRRLSSGASAQAWKLSNERRAMWERIVRSGRTAARPAPRRTPVPATA